LYEERLLHKGKSSSTLYSYRIAYRQFEEIHNMTLRHLSAHPDIVRRIHSELTTKGWQSKRQNARPVPRSADEAAKFVGAVYKNAKRHQRNLPAELPTTSVNWNRENPDLVPKRVSYAFTELAEWERWRQTIKNPVIREMALFLLLSGLRDQDCRTMRWDDIDGSVLRRPKPKGGKSRAFDVPLPRRCSNAWNAARPPGSSCTR
jgi:integrase